MESIRRQKVLSIIVLTFFCLFIFDSASFAKKQPYPKYAKIQFKLDGAKVKVKRVNKQVIPLELKIKNKTFKFVKQGGKYGIRLKNRDMVKISPEFKNKLGTSVVKLGLYRVKDLVKGDRKKAQEIVDQQKKIRKQSSMGIVIKKRFAKVFKQIISFSSVTEAAAQEHPNRVPVTGEVGLETQSEILMAASNVGVDRQYLSQMNRSYNQVLNSQSFYYPAVQPDAPSIGGWDVVSDDEEESNSGGEEEESDEAWYDILLGLILITIVLLAPVAAVVFLCANPLTIASVLTAFAGSVGAITGASIAAVTLGTLGDLLSGKPIIESFDYTTHSSETSYYTEIGPGQWAWP